MGKGKTSRTFLLLHLLLALYSVSAIFSKTASAQEFMSFRFILFYGVVLLILFVYALGWQQMLKRLPLTVAFASKAVTVVWGIFWGWAVFHEAVTWGKVLGAAMIIAGIILYSGAEGRKDG